MKGFLGLILSICFFGNSAQNQSKLWYFGQKAGLDFSSNPPLVLSNSSMYALEGCASICDASGNLLFYTNGDTIWNQQHQVMANGIGIGGDQDAVQSALIVKQAGNSSIYYVFLQSGVSVTTTSNFCYAKVDMSLAAPNGSVVLKNQVIHGNSTEKQSATLHCNNVDTWVMSHEANSNLFRAYLLNAQGLSPTSTNTAIGPNADNIFGGIKFSPNGRRLAMVSPAIGSFSVIVFDFDRSTGIVSNSICVSNTSAGYYSVEFSPDGSKLYASINATNSKLLQWDLCAGNAAAIAASCYTMNATPNPNFLGRFGTIQLGLNGKLYLSRASIDTLAVVHQSNLAGAACNFVESGLPIAPGNNYTGLPNFVTGHFKAKPASFTINYNFVQHCATASFSLPVLPPANACSAASPSYSSVFWQFGDPLSGPLNVSALANPSHVYSAAGNYTVQLVLMGNCTADTLKQVIAIPALPSMSVSANQTICAGESLSLSVSGANTYSWSTGSSASLITVQPSQSTTYTVTGTYSANVCVSQKTVQVFVAPCLSLSENSEANRLITLYPNPNSGLFTIQLLEEGSVKIYNAQGTEVYRSFINKGEVVVDGSERENGVYLFTLTTAKGEIFQRKWLKVQP